MEVPTNSECQHANTETLSPAVEEKNCASHKRKLSEEESLEEDHNLSKRTKGDMQSSDSRDLSNTQDTWERGAEEAFGNYRPPYPLSSDDTDRDRDRHKRKDFPKAPPSRKQPLVNNTVGNRPDNFSFADRRTDTGTKFLKKSNQKKPQVPDPVIYRYPIILTDEGTGTDQYRNYGFDTNRIWTNAKVGTIKCQRECGPKGKKGGKWILECCSKEQQLLIAKMTSTRTEKGVIRFQTKIPEERTEGVVGPIPLDYTAEEIARLLTENKHQHIRVSQISRLNTKTGERSKAVRLVFYAKKLPTSVQIGTQNFKVEPFRRQVKRCTRCQKLDHDKRECTSTRGPRCPKCLEDAHPHGAFECKLERPMWKCINCHKRGHSSAFGGCQEVLVRKKALELQAQEYMPFAIAMARAKKELSSKSSSDTRGSEKQAPLGIRRPLFASSPTRQLNFAAAIKVGVPDVSLIEKPDSRPYGYRRRVHVQVPRNEAKPAAEANTQPPAASWKEYTGPPIAREKTTTHTPSDVDKGQEDAKSPQTDNSANSENNQRVENEPGAGLLQQIKVMMDTHTAAIENKIKLQCEVLNCKIEKISNDVLKLTAERQQQLDLARQVILKGIEVSKDPVTKCAFDILECFRQAARGNSEAVMNLAFKITPDHLRSSQMTPPKTPNELLVALQNIVQPVD
ncbi:hypothetical protein ACOMHN_040666 [Nucella lapillus]